ncbi:hypothetical protein LAZ67_5000868 [Cordylochernes scorpioides]|uniref:Uncharacterized protein n=1 Tax=Cordylochernes scorpioides TaxID=51811 RepID=A0ABY6KF68_9ARAC|nr:hypothetical protein LAZ67_5000868 [Cordylochernes scorpioides]
MDIVLAVYYEEETEHLLGLLTPEDKILLKKFLDTIIKHVPNMNSPNGRDLRTKVHVVQAMMIMQFDFALTNVPEPQTCSYGILKEEMIRDRLDSEEKPKGDGLKDSDAKPKGAGVRELPPLEVKDRVWLTDLNGEPYVNCPEANPHTSDAAADVAGSSTSPGRTVRPPRRFGED